MFRLVFQNLKVKCPAHLEDGCPWTGDYASMGEHVAKSCGYVGCTCKYCKRMMRRICLAEHEGKICEEFPLPCSKEVIAETHKVVTYHDEKLGTLTIIHQRPDEKVVDDKKFKRLLPICSSILWTKGQTRGGCGTSILRKNLQAHLALECPETIISCPQLESCECTDFFPRKQLLEHYDACGLDHVCSLLKLPADGFRVSSSTLSLSLFVTFLFTFPPTFPRERGKMKRRKKRKKTKKKRNE